MRIGLLIAALLLTALPSVSVAAPTAQTVGLTITADIVTGAGCLELNRFAPGDKVVFRAKVFDEQTDQVDPTAQATLRLSNGVTLPMRFGPHPAGGPATDQFWTAAWTVPAGTPLGIIRWSVDAVDGARTGHFEPFNVASSLLTIVAAPTLTPTTTPTRIPTLTPTRTSTAVPTPVPTVGQVAPILLVPPPIVVAPPPPPMPVPLLPAMGSPAVSRPLEQAIAPPVATPTTAAPASVGEIGPTVVPLATATATGTPTSTAGTGLTVVPPPAEARPADPSGADNDGTGD